MKSLLGFLCIMVVALTSYAQTSESNKTLTEIKNTLGIVPTFMKGFPQAGLPGAWDEFKAVQLNSNTALDGRTKELIGLAVAAQIPCRYCVTFHKKGVTFNGGTKQEMNTAIAVGAIIRKWAAYFSGNQIDMAAFKADIDKMTATLRKNAGIKKEPIVVTDMTTAQQDITNTFGFVPSFLKSYPESAMAGSWNEVRNVILSPDVLPMKSKFLISLAVSSQAGCPQCVYLDTEMSKTQGATMAEIQEAIGMAGVVRHWSTVLNGLQQDDKAFQKEVDGIFKHLEKNRSKEKMKIGVR